MKRLTFPQLSTTAAYIYRYILLRKGVPIILTNTLLALTNGEKELLAQIASFNPILRAQKPRQ